MDFTDAQKAQIRAALGLGDDEEITAEHVMAMAAKAAAAPTPPAATGPATGDGNAPAGDGDGEPQPAQVAAGALPAGVIAVDADVWADTQARIRQGEAARREQLTARRDRDIEQAVMAGKFPAARVPHWQRLYDRDPEGTQVVLASLTPGVVPTQDIGVPGGPMAAQEAEDYERLFPPAYTRTAVFTKD